MFGDEWRTTARVCGLGFPQSRRQIRSFDQVELSSTTALSLISGIGDRECNQTPPLFKCRVWLSTPWVILLFIHHYPVCAQAQRECLLSLNSISFIFFLNFDFENFFLSFVYTYTTSSVRYNKEDAVVEVVASTELFSESWGLFYLREASVHVLHNSPTSEQNMTYVTLDVMYLTSNTDVTGCQSKCLDWQWSRGCELIQTSGTTAGWLLLSTRDSLTGTNNHTKLRTSAK